MQAKWYKCHGDSITRFLARNIEFKFWSIFLYDCRQSGISQWTLHAKFKRWKNGEYDRHNLSTKIYTTLPVRGGYKKNVFATLETKDGILCIYKYIICILSINFKVFSKQTVFEY